MKTTTYPNGLTVLSLFDGIACGRLALDKAGITIDKYYSSEICPHALAIQNYHYSGDTNFIQLGDVTQINGADYAHVNLINAGSPCIQLSSINPKDRSGLDGKDSSLFYEFIRIIKEIKAVKPKDEPLFVLLENVASMPNSERDKITKTLTEALGEKPTLTKINSSDWGAGAHRRRYYWTNWGVISKPDNINDVQYKDIIVNGYVDKDKANVLLSGGVTLQRGLFRHYKMGIGNVIFKSKSFAELPTEEKLKQYPEILEASGYEGKSRIVLDEHSYYNGCYRTPSVLECSRLMGIPDDYLCPVETVSKSNKIKAIGLGFTVDVVAHILTSLKPFLE
ncbi:hypothetical protein G5B10_11750 [Fluviicola sp. SGL-29]|nr:hypothetical protein [Fluviicola sp. SGL-29]